MSIKKELMVELESSQNEESIKFTKFENDEQKQQISVEELQQRADQIKELNKDVLAVRDMMVDLNSMVHHQQEHLDHLEQHVNHTKTTSEIAHQELIKAEEYQKSYYEKLAYMPLVIGASILVIVGILKR